MVTMTIALMLIFATKHYIADFLLQNEYMLGKFKEGPEYMLPLIAHAGTHALLTFTIAYVSVSRFDLSLSLAGFDFISHFVMDRIKAAPIFLGQYQALSKTEMIKALLDRNSTCPAVQAQAKKKILHNKIFWLSLGFDQLWHNVTDIIVAGTIALQLTQM